MNRILIESILASDAKALTQLQQKLNTWITTGLLISYKAQTTATHIVFIVCLKKEA